MRTKAMDFMSKTMHPVASSAVYVLRFWDDEFVVHDVFLWSTIQRYWNWQKMCKGRSFKLCTTNELMFKLTCY